MVLNMKVIEKEFEISSRKESTWFLIPLGDIHLGHKNCDLDLLQSTIDFIKKTPKAIVLGMGDYCDAISPKDARFSANEIDPEYPTPDVQYKAIENLFRPIKNKIIGLLDGNHDLKHWKEHAHNYVDMLAYNLGVPYLSIDAYIRLKFIRLMNSAEEHNTFNIYAHHGCTASRTKGAKINKIEDLAKIFPGLDLYLMGHVHERGESPPRTFLYVNRALNIIHREQHFVFTGGYLRGYIDGSSSYIEEKTLEPTALGSPIIKISAFRQNPRAPRIECSSITSTIFLNSQD